MSDSRTRRMTLAELRDAYDRLENELREVERNALSLKMSHGDLAAAERADVKGLIESHEHLEAAEKRNWNSMESIERGLGRLERKTDIDVERFNHFMCCSFPRIQWKRPWYDVFVVIGVVAAWIGGIVGLVVMFS